VPLLDRDGVGRGADPAGRVQRRGDEERLVNAVGGAVGGKVIEPPELAERHPELAMGASEISIVARDEETGEETRFRFFSVVSRAPWS